MTGTDKTIYLIYAGVGRDGGFGDYTGASWSTIPIKVDGETIWFEDESDALELCRQLSDASAKTFYNEATYEQYNGMFPMEYEARKIVIPSTAASTADNFQKIFESQKTRWADPELDSDDDLAEFEERRNRRSAR